MTGITAVLALAVMVPPAAANHCTVSAEVVQEGNLVTGTSGNDTIDCSGGFDPHAIESLAGDDTVTGSDTSDDFIDGGAGDDDLDGGANVGDTVSFFTAADRVFASLSHGVARGGAGSDTLAGFENVIGSPFGDILVGDDGINTIRAHDGNDLVLGLGGFDVLEGGPGNDLVGGGDGGDEVTGDDDDDFLAGGKGDDTLTGNAGDDTAAGGPDTDDCDAERERDCES